jgi:hypothetical protein
MDQSVRVFFSLLRSGLWGGKCEVPDGFDGWKDVLRLAREQSVLGLVGERMLSDDALAQRVPDGLKAGIKTFLMSNVLAHGKINSVLHKTAGALREAGIEPVLLKGQGLAANYPKPELRQCGDIDLYVGTAGYVKSHQVLEPLAESIDNISSLEVGRHFHVKVHGVEVEVHRFSETYPSGKLDRIYQAASDRGLSEDLRPLMAGGVSINTPSPGFNAFYIFSHFFYHFLTSGVGFRQLCDWVMHLHAFRDEIDTEELGSLIDDMGMMKPWKAFGNVICSVLGFSAEEFPFFDESQQRLTPRIVRRMLDEGNFGKKRSVYSGRGKNYILDKTRSMIAHVFRTFQLMGTFPSQAFRRFVLTMWDGFAKVFSDAKIRVR